MTREEREEYVIRLYKENNSIREIAKIMHMSFRDIGAIINKAKLQAERERGYTTDMCNQLIDDPSTIVHFLKKIF